MRVSLITTSTLCMTTDILSVCLLGYTCRCTSSLLFGSPALQGAQAQYVRVPKAGGTLYNLTDPSSYLDESRGKALAGIADSSLLLLGDILPTGVFAALQSLTHPKVPSALAGKPWPESCLALATSSAVDLPSNVKVLTFAVIGLGPVGVCASISLLDMLATRNTGYRIVAVDPNESRREKMQLLYNNIGSDGKGEGKFVVASIERAKTIVNDWTNGVGCTAVLEVSIPLEVCLFVLMDLIFRLSVTTAR